MKGSSKFITLMLSGIFAWTQLSGQSRYSDFKSMSQRVTKLAADYQSLCSVKSLVKTAGGKDIWVLAVGSGDREKKPAIAVVGGIEGNYLLGSELAVGFAENLLKHSQDDSVKSLLEKITFYILPCVSPDATEQYFSGLKYERTVNSVKTDDDRDFSFDEDPPEDLNNDGCITFIRVTDPTGTMTESEEDKRILVPADLSKGQKGMFLVYPEGVDNDKDGSFNEDGPGGVNFNRNFTYNFEEFGINSGLHAVSEAETKAVADFLYDHFNIYATIAFGPQDNLGQSARTAERGGGSTPAQGPGQTQAPVSGRGTGDRRLSSVMKTDETVVKLVSDKYREITGLKGSPPSKTGPGNFADWAYYHYGRYSFSTPGWWIAAEKGKNTEAAFLKYAEENKLNNVFVEWTEIQHPDFPGKKVEVGGIKPFAVINPPAEKLDELANLNYKFIIAVAALHPQLEFVDLKVENVGEDVFRVSVKVHNSGLFATCAEAGDMNLFTRIMRITADPTPGQSFLSGQKVQRIQRLEGDKFAGYSWLVSGKGTLKITAGALNTGTISTSLELK